MTPPPRPPERSVATTAMTAVGLLLLAGTGAVLWMAAHMPVYTDEMVYRVMNARYRLDGGTNLYLFPNCGPGFTQPVPAWMVPIRLVEELAYRPRLGLLRIREIGVGLHVLFIALAAALLAGCVGRTRVPRAAALAAFVGLVAVLSLGVLPFAAVYNRPEQWIRLALLVWALLPLALAGREPERLGPQALLLAGAYILPAAVIASMHLKTVLCLPLAALSLWLTVPRPALRGVGLVALVAIVASAAPYWSARVSCPEAPSLNDFLGQALVPSQLWTDPALFVATAVANLLRYPVYWSELAFAPRYISDWLPGIAPGPLTTAANALMQVSWGTLLALAVMGIAAALVGLARRRRIDRAGALLLGIAAVAGAMATVSIPKYFHESPLMLPLLAGAAFLAILRLPGAWRLRAGGGTLSLLAAAALASQAAAVAGFWSRVDGTWAVRGYTPGQFISFNYRDYEATRREALETAAMCGIDTTGGMRHLVVDDLAYPAFYTAYRPYYMLWVGLNWPGSPGALLRFLARQGSPGAVGACHLMPAAFKSAMRRNGNMCCMPAFTPAAVPPAEVLDGAYALETVGATSFQWLRTRAVIDVESAGPTACVGIRLFAALSTGAPQIVEIEAPGVQLRRIDIEGTGIGSPVEVRTRASTAGGRTRVTLQAGFPARRFPNDPRDIAMGIEDPPRLLPDEACAGSP